MRLYLFEDEKLIDMTLCCNTQNGWGEEGKKKSKIGGAEEESGLCLLWIYPFCFVYMSCAW